MIPLSASRPPRAPAAPDKAFTFAPLTAYPWKKRLAIRAASLGFYGLINLIGRTVRFEVEGWQHWEAATRAHLPVMTFWHDSIFLATYFFRRRNIVVMTSQSFDGEYIARFIQRFGYGVARGSSTRGSVGAVIEMVRMMRQGYPAGFTIDGPKGPRRVAKLGAVLLAKKTGQPVLPFAVVAKRRRELKSWDRFQIPGLFTRARLEIAAPIFVPPDANDEELEAKRLELQQALEELDRRGEAWRGPQA
ncbi:MAG: lysophospholipid acyltransferase family protein [Gemmataceae bacterium]